eukprot:TRINITY_DN70107_c0_g1_i1.p1 TRINITY_DN70107_c0_g1~~TRINITY_DN70107_c0_g1_i1.p1  ORF type:complete len:628 (+),score=140.84 TRINITY_DN70107_c0_g1_i1:56-1939(+)
MDYRVEEQLRLQLFGSVHDAFETCARVQLQMREDLCRSIDLFLAQANGIPVCSIPPRKVSEGMPGACTNLRITGINRELPQAPATAADVPTPPLQSVAGSEKGHFEFGPFAVGDLGVPEERASMPWNVEVNSGCEQSDALVIGSSCQEQTTWNSQGTRGKDDVELRIPVQTNLTPEEANQGDDVCGKQSKQKRMNSRVGLEVARRVPQQQKSASKPLWRMSAAEVLESSRFDNTVGALILMNAIVLGVQADYAARNRTDTFPRIFSVFERVFAVAFLSELLLRLWVLRGTFFCPKTVTGVLSNYFDLLVVSAQMVEEFLALLSDQIGIGTENFRVLRVLRILRLVRVLRVMRVLRLISELRTIVSSILGSFKSLFWTMVLLLLMIYIVGVYFTQCVTNHMVEKLENLNGAEFVFTEDEKALDYYFGSLARTLLTLWEAIAGGEDWDRMAAPLGEIQAHVALVFVCYIAFALLALMNVVTGFFVHTALLRAKKEEEVFVADQIVNLFRFANEAGEGEEGKLLTEEDIICVLADTCLAAEWKAIDILPAEAQYIFRLLDVDNVGSIAFEEFMSGCLRIKGQAQSLDVLTVLQEQRMFIRRFATWQAGLEKKLDELRSLGDSQKQPIPVF